MSISTITTTIAGNCGSDPELRYTAKGTAWASVNVAVTPRSKGDDGQWSDGKTTWIKVKAFGQLAENLAETVSKGTRLLATGRLELDEWTGKDGQTRQTLTMIADDAAPSMNFSRVHVNRTERSSAPQAAADPVWTD